MRISPALLTLALLPACRPDGTTIETVSDDPVIQAKLETARSTLADIVAYKRKGKNVYPDCKTAEMLFYKDLRRLQHRPAAKKLLAGLQEACRNVNP